MSRTWPNRWIVFWLDEYGNYELTSYATREEQRNAIKECKDELYTSAAVIGIDTYDISKYKYLIGEVQNIIDILEPKLKKIIKKSEELDLDDVVYED